MMHMIRGQLKGRSNIYRGDIRFRGNAIKAKDFIRGCDEERAVLVSNSRGLTQLVNHDPTRALVALVGHFVHTTNAARADVKLSTITFSDFTPTRNSGSPKLSLETRRELEFAHGDVGRRGHRQLAS